MRAGAALAEFDAVKNMFKARNFYQYLAEEVGVRTTKVWLNASGARFCPPRVNACGGGNLNMYRGSVAIPRAVLDDVMREVTAPTSAPLHDCGVSRDEEGSKMYRATPRQPGWGALEARPWAERERRGGVHPPGHVAQWHLRPTGARARPLSHAAGASARAGELLVGRRVWLLAARASRLRKKLSKPKNARKRSQKRASRARFAPLRKPSSADPPVQCNPTRPARAVARTSRCSAPTPKP